MSKFFKLALGFALLLVGSYTIYLWWSDVLLIIRGGIGIGLILMGLVFFALLD